MMKKVYKTPTVECREIGLTTVIAASTGSAKGTDFGTGTPNGHRVKHFGYTITLGDSY